MIAAIKRYPYLSVGWFWYFGTLIPAIGLVQVGAQGMADRFTYLPFVGLFIMIAWGVPDLLKNWRYKNIVLSLLAGIILTIFTVCSWFYVQYWQNSKTISRHALDVTENNYQAEYNLAYALWQEKRTEEAIHHFREALKIKPNPGVHRNLGRLLAGKGDFNGAIRHYNEILKVKPGDFESHQRLGILYAQKGELKKAFYHFQTALSINPNDARSHNALLFWHRKETWRRLLFIFRKR